MNLGIIFRKINRQKLNNGVIVISLAVGMACLSLISIFIVKEKSTDNFHPNGDRIYALTCDNSWEKGKKMYECDFRSVTYMTENFSQIEDYCLLSYSSTQKIIANNEKYFDHPAIIKASENFFNFFGFQLITNNGAVLKTPNSIVISEDIAMKYFGTLDAVNKVITLVKPDSEEEIEMIVSGVCRKSTENTHLQFDMVCLLNNENLIWRNGFCYFRLTPNSTSKDLQTEIDKNQKTLPTNSDISVNYYLKPLKKIHFDPDLYESRNIKDLWIAAIIGLTILIVSALNYLGIINNKLIIGVKSFKIKRINGGSKREFIQEFMVEHFLLIGISFAISILLILWITPFFNKITSSSINITYLLQEKQLAIQAIIALFLIIVTYIFVAIKVNTTALISGSNIELKDAGKLSSYPVFSIIQLISTLTLIICSIVIIKQINFILNKPIGMDKNVIQIVLPGTYSKLNLVFKEELIKYPSVKNVSNTWCSPLGGFPVQIFNYNLNGKNIEYISSIVQADANYIETCGIKLIKGESFSGDNSDQGKCVINETFAKLFPSRDLIGNPMPGNEGRIIVGMVKDFNYSSLKSSIGPVAIFVELNPISPALLIKPNDNGEEKAYSEIKKLWTKLVPDYPMEITTIGEKYEEEHQENQNFIKLIGSCCLISIFLSMIGLFTISYQNSHRRTKEVGIRRANGAKYYEVVTLLNKDFVKWVVIAFVIATPLAWFAMHKWLENFAYKTELSWWIFALAGLLALGIALLTVSFQSWKAATKNPVESLRYE
jgi:putative ABC transport system permease protein